MAVGGPMVPAPAEAEGPTGAAEAGPMVRAAEAGPRTVLRAAEAGPRTGRPEAVAHLVRVVAAEMDRRSR